jgi:hypothetical protein
MENLRSANRSVLALGVTGIIIICFMMNGCTKKNGDAKPATPDPAPVAKDTSVKYTITVKPIIDKYCVTCHGKGYAYPFDTYNELKGESDNGNLDERLFNAKDMPPVGYPKPTQAELNSIKKWISDGCKE